MMRRYAVVVERASERNWSAFVPDVDGCISTGATAEECLDNIRAALQGHLAWMAREGDPLPEPWARAAYVDVQVEKPIPAEESLPPNAGVARVS